MRIMTTPRLTLLLVLLLFLFQLAIAQNRPLSGRVTDQNGTGVPGVTVTVRGTQIVTQTDANGNYTLNAPDNATLIFSSVGYETSQVNAGTNTTVNATLTTATSNLNEVVVVGYGTARRRDVTGSVASVRAKDFNKGVIVSPDQAIQGKVAGVMVVNNSGQPGGATTVRIRGTSSIRSSNQPLFVVDGVPLSGGSARPGGGGAAIGTSPNANPLNFINPNDIASIEILKDASATAIYGSRGANGVVIITTKRGLSGTPTIEASASAGVSGVLKRLEVLNASEYRAALKQYNITSGGDYGGDVDAFDEITQKGIVQNYSAAVTGGSENGRYRISLGYLNQEGIIKESGLKRVTAGLTSNFRFLNNRKLGLDFNVITANNTEDIAPISTNAGFTGSLIGQALQWNPTHPLRKPNDSIWVNNQIGATTINPLAMLAAH
ncbi:MAG: TonB-dependent receptor plug domain-containing protein [Bacteroidota bacterium]|nr:TonB-dependent receptor plug domain-containing protein [Bacteroidota bacterium]